LCCIVVFPVPRPRAATASVPERGGRAPEALTSRPVLGPAMAADLEEKTDRYEGLLAEALDAAEIAPPEDSPMGEAAAECLEMATSYLEDGRHFRADDDLVNALASFSYGHAWLDAGARVGLFDVPREGHLFTV